MNKTISFQMNIQTQLVTYEYTISKTSQFDDQVHRWSSKKCVKSPVLKLFCRGISAEDEYSSVLVTVHGYYPYFFVLIPDDLLPSVQNFETFRQNFCQTVESQVALNCPQTIGYIQQAVHDI